MCGPDSNLYPILFIVEGNMALNYMQGHFAVSSVSLKTSASLAPCCCQLWGYGLRPFVTVQLLVSV